MLESSSRCGASSASIFCRSLGQCLLIRTLSVSSVTTTTLSSECRSIPQYLISAYFELKKQSSYFAFYSSASQRGEVG